MCIVCRRCASQAGQRLVITAALPGHNKGRGTPVDNVHGRTASWCIAMRSKQRQRYVMLSVCLSVCRIMARPRPLSRPQKECMVMAEPPPLLCVVRFVSLYHRPPPRATVFRQFLQRTCAVSGQRRAEKNFPAAAILFSLKVVIVCRAAKMAGKTFCNLMQERRMSWTQIFSQFEK